MTYNCVDTTKSNTVITTILVHVGSGVEDEDTVFVCIFKCTLQHVTSNFAHMNGHWKAYDNDNGGHSVIIDTLCVRQMRIRIF